MKSSLIITIGLIILFSSCKESSKDPVSTVPVNKVVSEDIVELTSTQIKNAAIEVGVPESREMYMALKVTGVIDVPPQNIISVSIPLGGYLKNTSLIPGERVSKGSVLATLEDQQYIQLQQDYLTAKSRLEFVQADYNRQKALNETKSTSDKIFQQAKTDFESQKIMLKGLSEKLQLIGINADKLNEENISRRINILSPISGYVTKVNVNIGKYVNPEDVLFEIIDPGDLHLRLTVFENDAVNLSIGQKLVCSTNSRPEEKYIANVHFITPNISEERSTDVHCHIEGNTKRLIPGTYMNAEIKLNNARVTAVPEDAVVKWESKSYVFNQEAENKFRLVSVETGVSNLGFIEIKTSLPAGKIVVKNAYNLLMKMKNSEGEE